MQRTIIKIYLTVSFLFLSTNLYELSAETAHNQETQQKVEGTKDGANKVLIDSLKKAIERTNSEIKKANGDFNTAKKNYEKTDGIVRLNLINRGLDKAVADTIDIKKLETIDADNVQRTKQQEMEVAELKQKIEETTKATEALKAEIEELAVIRDSIVSVTIAKHESLLDKPFSQIEPLFAVIEECRQYNDDAQMRAFISKLDTLYTHQRVYNKGLSLLSTGYDSKKVQESIGEFHQTIALVKESQRDELQDILGKLELYREGVLIFIEFIEGLNKEKLDYFRFEDFCRYKEKMMKENSDRTNKWRERYERCIVPIPYLKKSFELFEQEIKKAPLSHPIIELEILRHKKE